MTKNIIYDVRHDKGGFLPYIIQYNVDLICYVLTLGIITIYNPIEN